MLWSGGTVDLVCVGNIPSQLETKNDNKIIAGGKKYFILTMN